MAKIELTSVHNARVDSVKADKVYQNGELVGLGKLVEGEGLLYEAVEATADNALFVSTPELKWGEDLNVRSYDFENAKGSVMRAHLLDKGDSITIEQKLVAEGLTAGTALTVTGGKLAAGEGDYVVDMVRTIGVDRRPAYQIRKVK